MSDSKFSPYLHKPSNPLEKTQSELLRQIALDFKQLKSQQALASSPSFGGSQVSEFIPISSSNLEQAILDAKRPFEIEETDIIDINGIKGLWANKQEIEQWQGVLPLSEYPINQDDEPDVIRKETNQAVIYKHEVAIRFLKPPTPPPPGDLIIKQENNICMPVAPPVIIRQPPARPKSVEPLVIREEPPQVPTPLETQIISLPGKTLEPPPRKVVIEKFVSLPDKPQNIIIEKWLPYKEQIRNVIYVPSDSDQVIDKPKNLIIEWQTPKVVIKEETKHLGTILADPLEYAEKYKGTFKSHSDIVKLVKQMQDDNSLLKTQDSQAQNKIKLVGDIDALKLIDLDAHGLSEYKHLLNEIQKNSNETILDSFKSLNIGLNGIITLREAEKCLLILNSQLGKSYGDKDAIEFFNRFDQFNDGFVNYSDFLKEFLE